MKNGAGATPTPTPVERIWEPFRSFARIEASSGILLILCALAAMVWANSPWAASYFRLWETEFAFRLGDFSLEKDLLHWINDGLMAVFFFVVGLEIKREVLVGELASVRRAALPIAAALGGMATPALIYVAFNAGGEGASGWGIPMATDIAFALGVLALLGSRVPDGLKLLLAALAIVDDIGAVLVIALFYAHDLAPIYLGWALLAFALMALANAIGVRGILIYAVLGGLLWLFVMKSGVHATIAGVAAAMAIPATSRIRGREFLDRAQNLLSECERAFDTRSPVSLTEQRQWVIQSLEEACEQVGTPLHRLEHLLGPWVAFVIMPLFALANAGVSLAGVDVLGLLAHRVSLGIILGLMIGNQLGITVMSWLAVKLRVAELPPGVAWRHVYGMGWVAGVGFTMALFIAGLAFGGAPTLDVAKVGIITGSIVCGVTGWAVLRIVGKPV